MFSSFIPSFSAYIVVSIGIINGGMSSLVYSFSKTRFYCFFPNKMNVVAASAHAHLFSSTPSTSDVDSPPPPPPSQSSSEAATTISYLMRNCGLSSKSALYVSKKIKLKSTQKSDSVLAILGDYGFSNDHVSALIPKYPRLLAMKPEEILKPKLEFLRAAGFSNSDIIQLITTTPHLIDFSLDQTIIPSFNFMRSFLSSSSSSSSFSSSDSNTAILQILKNTGNYLMPKHTPNIEILRANGVSDTTILNLFMSRPRCLLTPTIVFADVVHKVKEFGMEPSKSMFLRSIEVLCYLKIPSWEKKVEFFKSLGWSDKDIVSMIRRAPYCFIYSDRLIKKKMDFFKNKLGWEPMFVASHPVILHFSIQKRFIPRCLTLSLLMSKGLIENKTKSASPFIVSNKIFLQKYVREYQDKVPELVKAYQGDMEFEGWVDVVPYKMDGKEF